MSIVSPRWALAFLVLCAAELGSRVSAAQAQDAPHVEEARQRVTRGEALFERGDFDAALAEFEAAYEGIGEHPSRFLILYNIGHCHERRFRYDVALTYYQRYLDEGGRGEEGHEAVEANVRTLGELLSTLHVETSAASAEVFVDGRPVGAAPGDVRVPAGLHVISVRADGYVPAERELEIPAAGQLSLSLQPTRLSDSYYGISPALSLGFAGGALAALGVGIAFGLEARDERARLDVELREGEGLWSAERQERAMARLETIRSQSLVADILFGSAGVLGLTAVVLGVLGDWSFGARSEAEARARTGSVSVRLGPSSLGITGTF